MVIEILTSRQDYWAMRLFLPDACGDIAHCECDPTACAGVGVRAVNDIGVMK
jgi:hypothetical protein